MTDFKRPFIVDMAYQIIDLHEENEYLRRENERLRGYEEKYVELLTDSLHHGERMMGQILSGLLENAEKARPETPKKPEDA